MTTNKARRPRHVPQRTCVGCRSVKPKQSLVRIVRSLYGVQIDLTGKLAGRGAYLHNQRSCWEAGLKGSIARALKVNLSTEETENLRQFMQTLSEGEKQEPVPMG